MQQVNEENSAVLRLGSKSDADNDEGQGDEGSGEESGGRNQEGENGSKLYLWLNLIEAVSELTRYDFGRVYEMPVMEFFMYVSYVNYKRKKEEQQIKEFRAKMKNG